MKGLIMKMKTAYTGWMWLHKWTGDGAQFRARFEECVKELAYLGYEYLENFTFLRDHLTPGQVRKICGEYGILISALYANLAAGEEALKRDMDYVAQIGGKWLIASSPNWPEDQGLDSPPDWEEVKREADLCNRLGDYAGSRGIALLHNHHSYTPVCRRPEIDLFAELTDPKLVGFCVDNGHAAVAGMDAVSLVRDYAERVAYVHIKDLDPSLSWRGRGLSWVPLGHGILNFSEFFAALREIGFEGIVCAGLPAGCEKINRFESARLSRIYMRSALGL